MDIFVANAFISLIFTNIFLVCIIIFFLAEVSFFSKESKKIKKNEESKEIEKYTIAFLALFCGIIWGMSDTGLLHKIHGTTANAFAIFVTIAGAISVIKQWKEKLAEKEDKEELIKDIVSQATENTTNEENKEDAAIIFIDTDKINKKYAEEIANYLKEKYQVIPLSIFENTSNIDNYYETLKVILKESKLIVVPHFGNSTASKSWIDNRIRFYTRLMITDKVIIYTDQQISSPLRKIQLIQSPDVNCEKLSSAIEEKLGRNHV